MDAAHKTQLERPTGGSRSRSRSRRRAAGARNQADLEAQRRAVLRATTIGLLAWPTFIFFDLFMRGQYPGLPLGRFALYRLGAELALGGVVLLARRPGAAVPRLVVLQGAAFVLAAIVLSVMGLSTGGIHSVYLHGLSLIILVRSVIMPEPWQVSGLTTIPIALTFPAVMAVAALVQPAAHASWWTAPELTGFVSNYIFVLSTLVLGAWGGHAVWAAQQQLYRARRLGRYRLEAPIGEGGMSEIWLAWDESLRRKVALKILRTANRLDADAVRRFEREAQAASNLGDPHTIRIFDFGATDDGLYYMAMEYLAGADLGALVKQHGPLPVARAVRFTRDACQSLAEAHEAGIVHRDFKPHNLFVTRVGDDFDFVKLLDFGIARVAGEADPRITGTGAVPGTPAYIAPEIWQGGAADARSDVYAVGATLYFLVTGTTPFEGEPAEVLKAHLTTPPESPSARRGSPLPAPLEALILRCLAKTPADRYQTARELHVALAGCCHATQWTAADAERFWRAQAREWENAS